MLEKLDWLFSYVIFDTLLTYTVMHSGPYITDKTSTGKSWTSVLFKRRFDQDLFWFWKTFISIAAKLLKIFEPNLVSWLFTSQGIGLMKKCTQNWLKMSLMIRVNGHITLSCTWKYSLNERKLKQNTHLKQDLCSGFSRMGFEFWQRASKFTGGRVLYPDRRQFEWS